MKFLIEQISLLFNYKKYIQLVVKEKNITQKKQDNKKKKNVKSSFNNQSSANNLALVFDKHVNCEFEDKDVDATMKTMTKEP